MRRALAVFAMVALAVPLAASVHAADKEKKKRPALEVGSVPFDELGKDLGGNKTLISDHRGKVVIVSFWASWCGPCKKELPVLASVAKKVGPEHLKIIAINFRDEPKPFKYVVDVLKEYPITILRDSAGRTAKRYDVEAIPRMIVIGRDGKVAADHTGYGEDMIPEFVAQLNALLLART